MSDGPSPVVWRAEGDPIARRYIIAERSYRTRTFGSVLSLLVVSSFPLLLAIRAYQSGDWTSLGMAGAITTGFLWIGAALGVQQALTKSRTPANSIRVDNHGLDFVYPDGKVRTLDWASREFRLEIFLSRNPSQEAASLHPPWKSRNVVPIDLATAIISCARVHGLEIEEGVGRTSRFTPLRRMITIRGTDRTC